MLDLRKFRSLGSDDFSNETAWVTYKFQREEMKEKIELLEAKIKKMESKYHFFDLYRFWFWIYVLMNLIKLAIDISKMI